MAGDWIPMRLDLTEDPAVIHVAAATGIDEFGVVGRLHRLWSWANSQSRDGHADGVTEKWIDRYVGVTGFARALSEAGWLSLSESGMTIPKFDHWNSKGAKRRILATKRQSRKRHADVTPTAQQKRDQRREEKSINTPPTPVDGFGEFWIAYPRKEAKQRAVRAWQKLKPDTDLVARIISDVRRRSASEKWQENGGKYVPHPATYLNDRRWEDESATSNGQMDPELARRYAGDRGDDDL